MALAVSLELVLGIFVAVTLRRLFPGRGIVLAILVLPWALPSVVSGVLWRRVFDPDNGLLNSAAAQAPRDQRAARLARRRPLGDRVHHARARLGRAAARQPDLPGRPAEHPARSSTTPRRSTAPAAWRQFRHITLPLLRPSIAVAATIGTLLAIAIFDEVYVLNGTALNTRSILIQVYNDDLRRGRLRPRHGARVPARRRDGAASAALYVLALRRSTR